MAATLTSIAAQMITSLKVTVTTTLVNAVRGQAAKVSRYPIAELRFYGGGEVVTDFNSIHRAPLQAEILVRGKTIDQVQAAVEKVLILWSEVGSTARTALVALGVYEIIPVDWFVPDERVMGAEVIGSVTFDMKIEYTYTT